jgi:succinyl-diaminopimelate desuccinylase
MPTPPSVVELLSRLISIPSVNPMGRDLDGPEFYERHIAKYLVEFFAVLDVPHEEIEVVPGRSSNVLARLDSPGATQTILLDAHIDTVPVDGMTIPPFGGEVRDGRVWGRGACDDKGGLAAMLWAFKRLATERPAGMPNVVMSCTCDEEATTLGISDLVECWADGRSKVLTSKPDGAIIAEPTELDVVVAHRGAVRFKIRTAGRACHSSDPTQGLNAIYRMAHVVTALEEYAPKLSASREPHRLVGPPTISVGMIYGGASVNVVPDDCAIEIDRRLIPGDVSEEAVSDIRDFLTERLDFEFEFEPPWLSSPTLDDSDNGWLADAMLAHIEPVAGPHKTLGVPYGTHASRTCAAGVPSVVFGPGSIEQAHTKDEWLDIDQLKKASEIYFRFCSNPPDARCLD